MNVMCVGCGLGVPVCGGGVCSPTVLNSIFQLALPLGSVGVGIIFGLATKFKK